MKRIFQSFIFVFSVVLAFFNPAARADNGTVGAGTPQRPYLVLIDTSFVPFIIRKSDGSISGFDAELIRALAKRMNVSIKLQPMSFDGIVPALESHNADLTISGFSITPDRLKVLDFSRPYFDAGLAVLTLKGKKAEFGTAKQIAKARIGTQIATVSADYVRKNLPAAKLSLYSTIQEALLDLKAGRLDALVFDGPTLAYMLKVLGSQNDYALGERLTSGDYYAIAFPKGSPLVKKFNDELGKMFKDGSYAALYESWFGEKPDVAALPVNP